MMFKFTCRWLVQNSIAYPEFGYRYAHSVQRLTITHPVARCNYSTDIHPYTEEEIPVPWGVIRGRSWGNQSKKPVLLMHGWKDNAASFDRLLPLLLPELQDQFYFLAIDLPGHGFSSHFPPGMTYHIGDCLLLIARLFKYFKWTEPINYIGHSLGAMIGFMYAATNPGTIKRMVAIDALTPFLFKAEDVMSLIPKAINDNLHFETKLSHSKPPIYTYDEILSRVRNRNVGALDDISAKVLLTRAIYENNQGSGMYSFTHDIRVQYLPVMIVTLQQVTILAQNFGSSLLHIHATEGTQYERPHVRQNVKSWILSNPKAFSDREVSFIDVPGYHHLHLVTPERVAPYIIKFLKNKM